MKNILLVLKKGLGITLAGAVGAGIVLTAANSGELLGSAGGKKVGGRGVWRDVAAELGKPQKKKPRQSNQNNEAIESPDLGTPNLGGAQPEGPLQDVHDAAECNSNIRTKTYGSITRMIYKAEVRSYLTEMDGLGRTCQVQVYPKGCDRFFNGEVWAAATRRADGQAMADRICSQLESAAFHDRTVYVQVYQDSNSAISSPVVHRVSLMPGTIDEFSAQVDQSESNAVAAVSREAAAREEEFLRGLGETLSNFFNPNK